MEEQMSPVMSVISVICILFLPCFLLASIELIQNKHREYKHNLEDRLRNRE